MPNSSGLYFIVTKLLAAKSKKDGEAYIKDYVGDEYLLIAGQLLDRLTFKRTGKQNNFSHAWYKQISDQTGETELQVKCRAKLDFGCPILCADDPEYLEACKLAMGHLNRETRLEKIMPLWPCTRLMTSKQMARYSERFEQFHVEQGFTLSNERAA